MAFDLDTSSGQFSVNGKSFKNADPMPVLLQVLSGKNPNDLLPSGSVYYLPRNQTIEIQMPALAIAGRTHTLFHLESTTAKPSNC